MNSLLNIFFCQFCTPATQAHRRSENPSLHLSFKVRDNFPSLAFVSWDRPKLPFCGGKQCGQDAVISKPNPVHFRSARTKMPVLQPLLELGCLSQMQTNKANSTNWLDVWAKLLYGFNGRWWWTPSKESHAHRSGDFLPDGPAATPLHFIT